MADNKNLCGSLLNSNTCNLDSIAIDANRILDSCRDKDCFQDVRVFLTDFGQEIIERTNNIKIKSAKVKWTSIQVESIQFNRGFYQVLVRFFVKIVIDACICPGKTQEIEGIAVCEKRVVLYGSEGNVNIFKSGPITNDFCLNPCNETFTNNLPTAVVEVIDPIILGTKIINTCDNCYCCCFVEEVPDIVCGCINGNLIDTYNDCDCKKLFISLGFFSVIRIERPGQYLVRATEYAVPDKECIETDDEDACSIFKKMAFPANEFITPSFKQVNPGVTPASLCEYEKTDKKRC